jgi:hypothetical protein
MEGPSLVGYDDGQYVWDEERPVGRKNPDRKAEPPSKGGVTWPRWTGFRDKTMWDWLQLLIVPLALAVLGTRVTIRQEARRQRIEGQRAEAERMIQQENARHEALQAYFDRMSTFLLEKNLRESEKNSETRTLARTLTALGRLTQSARERRRGAWRSSGGCSLIGRGLTRTQRTSLTAPPAAARSIVPRWVRQLYEGMLPCAAATGQESAAV